jgi:hypothetical protein
MQENDNQNEEVTMEEEEAEVVQPEGESEIELLRKRANLMGIKFHPMTGVKKLKAQGLTENQIEEQKNEVISVPSSLSPGLQKLYGGPPMSQEQYLRENDNQKRKNINRLVRIQIACMNPSKSEWEGEIFSVGSAKLGTFKKYIPFNSTDGWHVPYILYEALKERKYTQFYNAKGPRGEKIRKGRLAPEFSIQVLPPLTKEELQELAQRQALARTA